MASEPARLHCCLYTTDSYLGYAAPFATPTSPFNTSVPPSPQVSPSSLPTSCHRLPSFLDSTAPKPSHPRVCSLTQTGVAFLQEISLLAQSLHPARRLPLFTQDSRRAARAHAQGPAFQGPGVPAPNSPRARCRLGEHGRFRSRTQAGAALTAAAAPRAPPSASLAGGRRGLSDLPSSRHGEELELRESRRAARGGTAAQ